MEYHWQHLGIEKIQATDNLASDAEVFLASIAISLKRIADQMEALPTNIESGVLQGILGATLNR